MCLCVCEQKWVKIMPKELASIDFVLAVIGIGHMLHVYVYLVSIFKVVLCHMAKSFSWLITF